MLQMVTDFLNSPNGVAFAAICTILSLLFAVFQKQANVKLVNENIELKGEVNNYRIEVDNSRKEIQLLKAEISSIELSNSSQNSQTTNQLGKNNVNTGNVSGDLNLDLS